MTFFECFEYFYWKFYLISNYIHFGSWSLLNTCISPCFYFRFQIEFCLSFSFFAVVKVIDKPALGNSNWSSKNSDISSSKAPYRIYNIGNNNPIELLDYIKCLEKSLGKIAKKEMMPLQPGDVLDTYANIDDFVRDFNYKPMINIADGIESFCKWYLDFYAKEIWWDIYVR